VNNLAASYHYNYNYNYGQYTSNGTTPRTLAAGFPDGTSNVVLMAEHYANCPVSYSYNYGYSYTYSGDQLNQWPSARMGNYFTAPSSYSVATIQFMPPMNKCNFSQVQAPRAEGILVSLADGSARLVNSSITTTMWQYALVPNDNQNAAW
jgi:hypothetical protein